MKITVRPPLPAEMWEGFVKRCKALKRDPDTVHRGLISRYGQRDPAVELRKLLRGSKLRGADYQAKKLELQIELERQEILRKEFEGEEE